MSGERNDVPGGDDARHTLPLAPAAEAERATLPLPGPGAETVPLAEPADPPLPGRVGRFEVRSWLGSGAFGDVYRAHDPQLDREVALKVAKPGSLDTPERLGRFLREAKAAANLRHPNIVPLYETGRDGDRHFIASAFISGRTLEAVIEDANERKQPPSLDVAARIVRKLADALAYAHSQGVVHRDVKPANVMIDESGEPHLLDFGLAARAESGDERLTSDGQGMGTPAYMAPEQADGHGIAASDQYSLGCTLYELVTGETPFGGGPAQQIFLHKTEPVPSPRTVRRCTPRDLETVTLKCLEKEAERRYGSCGDLAEDLRRFLANEPVKARRIGPLERFGRWCKRNPAVASSVSVAVLALLIGTVVSLAQRDEAKWQAKLATDNAADAATKKQLADEKTDLATKEAKRANDETAKANAARRKSDRVAYNSLTSQADSQVRAGELASAKKTLEGTSWELRGWEYGCLVNQIEGTGLLVAESEGKDPFDLPATWSPDGSQIAAGSETGLINVWDARTGRVVRTFQPLGGSDPIVSVGWSSDGVWIASGSRGGVVRVWDAAGGREVAALRELAGPVGVAWSPDSKQLLAQTENRVTNADGSWGNEANLLVWAGSARGIVLRRKFATSQFSRGTPFGTLSEWAPDGSHLLSVGGGKAFIWQAHDGREVMAFPVAGGGWAAWAPDGGRVLTASPAEGTTRFWDRLTGQELFALPGVPTRVPWNPDGLRLMTLTPDKGLKIWDTRTGRELVALLDPLVEFFNSTWSADGARVVSWPGEGLGTSGYGVARVWDAATGREVATFRGALASRVPPRWDSSGTRVLVSAAGGLRVWDVTDMEVPPLRIGNPSRGVWSPSGDRLAFEPEPGRLRVLDATTTRVLATIRPDNWLSAFAWSPDGTRLATTGFTPADRGVRVWDAATWRELAVCPPNSPAMISRLGWCPDGTRILTQSDKVDVYDAGSGRVLESLPGSGFDTGVFPWSPDGSRVLTRSQGGTIRVRNVLAGRGEVALWGQPYIFAWNSDGSRVLARGENDKTARILDTATGSPVATFPVPLLNAPDGGAWSPDGLRVALPSVGGECLVWDVAAGREVAVLRGHAGVSTTAWWSPDGTRLLTTSGDGTARLWDAELGRQLLSLPGFRTQWDSPWSPDGSRVLTVLNEQGRVWDGRFENLVARLAYRVPVSSAQFPAGGSQVVFRDASGGEVGRYTLPDVSEPNVTPPPVESGEDLVSPDHRFRVRIDGNVVRVFGRTRPSVGYNPFAEAWTRRRALLPEWHVGQARAAEERGDWFAAAFHRERLARFYPWDLECRDTAARARARVAQRPAGAVAAGTPDPLSGSRGDEAEAARVLGRVGPAIAERVRAGSGLVADPFVVVQTLPLAEFESLAADLGTSGYRPVRVRPYATAGGVKVAALWHRDEAHCKVLVGASREQAQAENERLREGGVFRPVEAAGWLDPGTKARPFEAFASVLGGPAGSVAADPGLRFVVVWASKWPAWVSALHLGVPGDQQALLERCKAGGPMPRGVQSVPVSGGGRWHSWVFGPADTVWDVHFDLDRQEYLSARPPGLDPVDVVTRSGEQSTRFDVLRYGSAGQGQPARVEVEQLIGLPPDEHLARMRRLSDDGWRPVAIAVTPRPGSDAPPASPAGAGTNGGLAREGFEFTSIWHRRSLEPDQKGPPATFDPTVAGLPPKVGPNRPPARKDRDLLDGPGLVMEVYQGVSFDHPVRFRRDERLTWHPGLGKVDQAVGDERFSIRWTGWVQAPTPGRYRLEFHADDGVRCWVGGKLVIDAWKSPQVTTERADVELTGRPQEIRIEYFQDQGGAGYDFRWTPPGATEAVVIPSSVLRPTRPLDLAPPPRPVAR